MEDVCLVVVGAACLLVGFVGCVVPVLPGVAFAYAALLALMPTAHALPAERLWVAGGIALASIVLDYVVPALGARKFNCSKWGVFGCLLGTIVGVFFAPIGILLGPFVGAVAGELVAGKEAPAALRGGFGALLGFLFGLLLKLIVCGLFAWWFARACWGS